MVRFTALYSLQPWEFRPIPVSRNLVLGIAKLLPQIVPVKRETLQVVSLAMTGLMPGSGPIFHIVGNRGRVCFVESGQRFPFWDRISRQGLGLPWPFTDRERRPSGTDGLKLAPSSRR
ncbi:hypothetical protein SBA2_40040 [Acidobacteriia bacterium SbA2]|nr:hypothetical protein SBA2_40040 [Acidobacteriia bacterium SbA2]